MGGVDPATVQALAAAAGLGPVRAAVPIAGGANNRVFRVEAAAGPVLLKSYFRHPDDPRDRLAAEWAFSHFAWDAGVRCVPRPVAADPTHGLSLYEFVAGRSLRGGVAGEAAVDQAIDFFRDLNRARSNPVAAVLPAASEACFTLADHFATVARRVERLAALPVTTPTDAEARAFVEAELVPAWEDLHAAASETDEPLAAADRCVSPSDFGFHNAILGNDGRLRFIDFEYAGWDDPAKLVCDFFCQPAVPAPAAAFDRFAAAVAAEFPDPEALVARATLLLPVYRVKWVCILLNEFLPVGGSRRRFSVPSNPESRKAAQLAKARAALAALRSPAASPRKVA